MYSPRRIIFYLGGAALLSFLLMHLQVVRVPSSLTVDFRKPDEIYRLSPNQDDGRFDWASLKVHYPVKILKKLPRPSKNRLPRVQHHFTNAENAENAAAELHRLEVKWVIQRCWTAYYERAWLQDELAPISGGRKSTFGGWAATLVDTLDTLWITDMKEEFHEAVDAALRIDFSKTEHGMIQVFETTIRYMGGFLSAYDLSGDKRLLNKTLELAEMLSHSFDTPNRMPILRWDFHKAAAGERQVADETVLVAEIGSLSVEFTRLAQITNDPRWYDLIARIMLVFEQQQQSTNLPGMWPLVVNATSQDFRNGTDFTFGAMADSLYEYIPKMFALLGGSEMYQRMYKRMTETAIQHALYRPMLPDNADVLMTGHVHADEPGKSYIEPKGQHLACFAGGMLALGGKLLGNASHVEVGRKLTDGCVWAYRHSELGIMPESFYATPCESAAQCELNETRWHADVLKYAGDNASLSVQEIIKKNRLRPGFADIHDRHYFLRPEAIESVFILYRITGDERLREVAWEMFTSIDKATRTDIANAALSDVTDPSAPKSDSMESFWTAETLKYFYLIFSDPSVISLDDYVFNTEAHPFKRPPYRV